MYNINKPWIKKEDFDENESNDFNKELEIFQNLQSSSNPNDISEKDNKTQNTQDYRKQNDFAIGDFNINFSGK